MLDLFQDHQFSDYDEFVQTQFHAVEATFNLGLHGNALHHTQVRSGIDTLCSQSNIDSDFEQRLRNHHQSGPLYIPVTSNSEILSFWSVDIRTLLAPAHIQDRYSALDLQVPVNKSKSNHAVQQHL